MESEMTEFRKAYLWFLRHRAANQELRFSFTESL